MTMDDLLLFLLKCLLFWKYKAHTFVDADGRSFISVFTDGEFDKYCKSHNLTYAQFRTDDKNN